MKPPPMQHANEPQASGLSMATDRREGGMHMQARRAQVWLLVAAALALVLERMTRSLPWVAERHELFAVVLAKSALLGASHLAGRLLGRSPGQLGLAWPARSTITLTGAIALGASAGGLALGQLAQVRAHYPLHSPARASAAAFALSTLVFAIYALAWELYFRGVLLFGAAPTFGRGTLALQALVFTLAHLGKPPVELALAFPGGLALGLLARHAKSALAPFVVHLALAVSVNLACVLPRLL